MCNVLPPPGGAAGSQVITPDEPFSLYDLTSDLIFYVQEAGGHARQDIFSLYVSDGHRQTEAFNVEIDIQVLTIISDYNGQGCLRL